MSSSPETFEEIHEKLIAKYLDDHPDADYAEASDQTAEAANAAWVDALAVRADLCDDAVKDAAIAATSADRDPIA